LKEENTFFFPKRKNCFKANTTFLNALSISYTIEFKKKKEEKKP